MNSGGYELPGGEDDIDAFGTSVFVTIAFTGWLGGAPEPAASSSPAHPTEVSEEPDGAHGEDARSATLSGDDDGAALLQVLETLPGGHVVSLKARPEVASRTVAVRLIEDSRSSELLHCNDHKIVAGGYAFKMRRVRAPQRRFIASESRVVTELSTTPKAIAALLEHPDGHIDICREAWRLSAANRLRLQAFMSEFEERGGARDEKGPTEPPPAAEPPASSEPSATPPAAAPETLPQAPGTPPASSAPERPTPSTSPTPPAPSTAAPSAPKAPTGTLPPAPNQ